MTGKNPMRKLTVITAALAGMVSLAGSVQAGSLSEAYGTCVERFANHKQTVTVMLLCTAADGKLADCKVLEAPSPANGFDKAAMCVADVLPIGSKTGPIKVPILFQALN
jgi:hypothetical protein